MSEVFYLEGVVQHYDWGGHYFIPELLGKKATAQPTAELWLGVHPKGMGVLRDNQMTLADYLASHGTALPFLLKVLDVRASLSIQVHPDKLQAEQGFARENHAGVALTAAHRNYKDDNHKPEVMVALTPCVLLYGFSEVAQIIHRALARGAGPDAVLIAETGGLVGLNYAIGFLHPEGLRTPMHGFDIILRHLDHLLGILGEDGVALGSDYDGAEMPEDLSDASKLQGLVQAMLDHGYGRELTEKIAAGNWIGVLERTWGG